MSKLVWVRDLPRNDIGIAHHPYFTFGYVSFGTQDRPDFEWHRSAENLLAEAEEEKRQMTHEELVSLFGADLVEGGAQPAYPAARVVPAVSRPSLRVR